MKIVMDKPSSSPINESTPVSTESTETNSDVSFLDLIMANFFVEGARSTDDQDTQSFVDETTQETADPAMEVIDVTMLNQLLTDLQEATSQQPGYAQLANADPAVLNTSVGTEIKTNTMKALDKNNLQLVNERIDLNAQVEEAVTTDQLKTEINPNDLVTKPINNNPKTGMRSNQTSDQVLVSENNDVRTEATKVSSTPVIPTFNQADANAQNSSKNQSNEMLANTALPNAPLSATSLSAHAVSMAPSFPKAVSTPYLDGQVLTANVSFQIEPLAHLKEKTMSQGVQHINISIAPPELGPISARLKMIDGNRMELDIMAKSSDIAQVIKAQLHTLRDQFASGDIRLDAINVQSQDLLSDQNESKGSDYEQSMPVDYIANPGDNDIKAKEKNQKVAETLIDAYV